MIIGKHMAGRNRLCFVHQQSAGYNHISLAVPAHVAFIAEILIGPFAVEITSLSVSKMK